MTAMRSAAVSGRATWSARHKAAVLIEDRVGATVVLGMAPTRLGRASEGEPLLRESLALAKANHLVGLAAPTSVEAGLGECLLAQERYAEAEPLLKDSYAVMAKALGDKHPTTAQVRRHLRELYVAWRRPDDATPYR